MDGFRVYGSPSNGGVSGAQRLKERKKEGKRVFPD